jgi:cell fate (sporulation/competence/biofilm development) regulator YlbF (YheA/YmcA/DUF963 family)
MENIPQKIKDQITDLCQTIIQDSKIKADRAKLEAFQNNPRAKEIYQEYSNLLVELDDKKEAGKTITAAEESRIVAIEDKLDSDPVAAAFMEANNDLHELGEYIQVALSKAINQGRLAKSEDFTNENDCCHEGNCCNH